MTQCCQQSVFALLTFPLSFLLFSSIQLFQLIEAAPDPDPRGRGGGSRGGAAGGGAAVVYASANSAYTEGYYQDGTGSGDSDSSVVRWYEIPIWGWVLILLPIMGILAICVALAAWKIFVQMTKEETAAQAQNNLRNRRKVQCPLCIRKVNERSWLSGRHRQKCARKYEEKIVQEWHVYDPDLVCPLCQKPLRKLPTNRLFRCYGGCTSGDQIVAGCFACDYNLCESCSNGQRAQNLLEIMEEHQQHVVTTNPTEERPEFAEAIASSTDGGREAVAVEIFATPTAAASNFVAPKTSPFFESFDPTAPAYDDLFFEEEEHLPSYEEAMAASTSTPKKETRPATEPSERSAS